MWVRRWRSQGLSGWIWQNLACPGIELTGVGLDQAMGRVGASAGSARFLYLAMTNMATPATMSAAVDKSTLATARGLFGSSSAGAADRMMVTRVVTNPNVARAMATGRPPGTRRTSGPAGRLCTQAIAAKRKRNGMKVVM